MIPELISNEFNSMTLSKSILWWVIKWSMRFNMLHNMIKKKYIKNIYYVYLFPMVWIYKILNLVCDRLEICVIKM